MISEWREPFYTSESMFGSREARKPVACPMCVHSVLLPFIVVEDVREGKRFVLDVRDAWFIFLTKQFVESLVPQRKKTTVRSLRTDSILSILKNEETF